MPQKRTHRPISVLLVCQWPTIECWLVSFVILGDPGNPIFLYFSGGSGPPVPLWISPWHASKRRYLSEMFFSACGDHRTQSRTIDYNSWYACLPLIRNVGRSSGSKLFANFDSRS